MSDLYIFSSATPDYEFTNFSFNGIHSSQYGLTAVVSGLSEESLAPFEDKLVDVQGRDGAYYFGTRYKAREFSVICAFDNLTSEQYRNVVKWLNPKVVGQLIFDERPYKYYVAKLASAPRFSFVPFEENITNGKRHIFKGEVVLRFTAPDPYGYGDYSLISDVPIWKQTTPPNGVFTKWSDYPATTTPFYDATHLPGWEKESGLPTSAPTNSYTIGATINSVSSFATHQIWNYGTSIVYPKLTISLPAYSSGSLILGNGSGNTCTINSLTAVTGSDDTGIWTFTIDPLKGTVSATTTDTDYTGITFNCGAIHDGQFLYLNSGSNVLTTNKTLTTFKAEFKHKYL